MNLSWIHDLALCLDFSYAFLRDVVMRKTPLELTYATIVEPTFLDSEFLCHLVKSFKREGLTDQVARFIAEESHFTWPRALLHSYEHTGSLRLIASEMSGIAP